MQVRCAALAICPRYLTGGANTTENRFGNMENSLWYRISDRFFLRDILNDVELTERHKKLIKQQTTFSEEVIQRDVLLQLFLLLLLLSLMYIMILMLKRGG